MKNIEEIIKNGDEFKITFYPQNKNYDVADHQVQSDTRFAKWDNSSTWSFVDGNGADGINQDTGKDAQQLNVVVYNNNNQGEILLSAEL